jgi:hypothetical protein
MICFKYLDLSTVPEDLIVEVYNSIDQALPLTEKQFDHYKIFQCNENLTDFVSKLFEHPIYCGIQVIKQGQEIHRDFGRTVAYNYIIEPGGSSVTTNFYTDLVGSKKIESVLINPSKWHQLRVSIPHQVNGIVGKRISITAWPK